MFDRLPLTMSLVLSPHSELYSASKELWSHPQRGEGLRSSSRRCPALLDAVQAPESTQDTSRAHAARCSPDDDDDRRGRGLTPLPNFVWISYFRKTCLSISSVIAASTYLHRGPWHLPLFVRPSELALECVRVPLGYNQCASFRSQLPWKCSRGVRVASNALQGLQIVVQGPFCL